MANIETTYMGLPLKNPLVVGSSGLTNSVENIIKYEKRGAAAVVLKSLFEEQINNEVNSLLGKEMQNTAYPEAEEYIRAFIHDNSLSKYLEFVKKVKAKVSIPIIASLSCVSGSEWISFAKQIEDAGADALEINAFLITTNRRTKSADIEQEYLDILTAVQKEVSIPVSMKIGSSFTNLTGMVDQIYAHGAKGVVLFNRFYEPDIDVNKLKITSSQIFSAPSDIRQSLRWTGIISGTVPNIDIAASTGIHDGEALVKQLLAGAKVGQVCSTIYINGEACIGEILDYLKSFMKKWNFLNIDEFRGRLNYSDIPNPVLYERAQFMKYFSNKG
jgi:dihydroorotate dehydrogenase (fumarate)